VARIGELGTMLAVSSNGSPLRRNSIEKGGVSTEYQIEDGRKSWGSR
jgi:hypothetical protein